MSETIIRFIDVDGLSLRVGWRPGKGPPLLIFNGIGANFELLDPLTRALDGVETIVFDVPGTGESQPKLTPYRLRGLARLAARLLDEMGHTGSVDVLGVSWGGALAQQFAFSCPVRCRRLVLAATTPGMFMVPGSPFALAHLFNPRRYRDASHLERVAPNIYGGEVRRDPALVRAFGERSMPPKLLGYLYQQLAFWGWSSLPWLHRLRQPTLILAGSDDPLVPLANARILRALIPGAQLQVVDDGHLFLLSNPGPVAPSILSFLAAA